MMHQADWHLTLRHTLLSHYHLSVLSIGLLFTCLFRHSLAAYLSPAPHTLLYTLLHALLSLVTLLPLYALLLLYLLGHYVPPTDSLRLEYMAYYLLFMTGMGAIVLCNVLSRQSREMGLSRWQRVS